MKKLFGIFSLVIFPSLAIASGIIDGFDRDLSEGWPMYLSLVLSTTAITMQIWRPRKPSKSNNTSENTMALKKINQDASLQSNLRKCSTIDNDVDSLKKDVKRLEGRIEKLEQPANEMVWDNLRKATIKADTEQPDATYQPEQNEKSNQEVLYAKYADVDSGFSSGMISEKQNGELVYEIKPDGDKAVYRISADPDAQKYALSDFAYTLGNACELLNQPFKGCRIVMEDEGLLVKTSGNWIIQQKIKIEFK